MEFVKYKNMWYQVKERLDENKAVLLSVREKTMTVNIDGLETCHADDFSTLDWNNTCIYSDSYETGWLSPNGEFYGCDFEHHNIQAKYIHNCYECDMERNGFIKLTYTDKRAKRLCAIYNKIDGKYLITPKQYRYLSYLDIENFDNLTFFYRYSRQNQNNNENSIENNHEIIM